MSLDVKTLLTVVCLVMLISTITMALLSLLARQYRAIKIWAVGDAFFTIGFAFFLFPEIIPGLNSIWIVNASLAIGILLIFLGISDFVGKPHNPAVYLIALIAYATLIIIFTSLTDRLLVKSIIVAAACGILACGIGVTIFYWSPRSLRFSHWFTGAIFIFLGACQFFRVHQLLNEITVDSLFSNTLSQSLSYMGLACFIVLWTVAAILMVGQRLSVELTLTSRIDFLTQALNRRAGQDRLEQDVKRIQRKGGVFSIVLIDLDDFKDINDNLGHPAGDATLAQISDVLRNNLRTEDMLCRWGGDEFLILLSDAPLEKAVEVARRLQTSVRTRGIYYHESRFECTLSIGIAAYTSSSASLEETIICADHALYEAKSFGGNKINVFQKHISDQEFVL